GRITLSNILKHLAYEVSEKSEEHDSPLTSWCGLDWLIQLNEIKVVLVTLSTGRLPHRTAMNQPETPTNLSQPRESVNFLISLSTMLYTHKINSLNSGDVYLVNAHCDVKEKDQEKKESYQATWLDLVMETRPEQHKAASPKDLYRTPSPSEYKSIMEFETIAKGVCSDKQEIFEITKDLPKVSQPIRVNFRASSLISPTREFSHSFRG
ncbi:unnamed protein product, partial [Coregonus sp. 'balchen']